MTCAAATVLEVTKVLGTTDEVTTCDCCGRQGLKKTVALLLPGSDSPVFYGVTCAAVAQRRTIKEIRTEAREADLAKARAAQLEREAASRIEHARWRAFLETASSTLPRRSAEIVDMIEALGGYRIARDAYLAAVGTDPR